MEQMIDTSHLDALTLRLSHERSRLFNAKTENEIEIRKVWVAQIEKEIAMTKKFLGIDNVEEYAAMNDDDLLDALLGGE